MTNWIVFDDGVRTLEPLTSLRPSFEVRTGALLTLDRLIRQIGVSPLGCWVPEELIGCVEHRLIASKTCNITLPDVDELLFVNGRWASMDRELPGINTAYVASDGSVVCAKLDRENSAAFVRAGCLSLPDTVRGIESRSSNLLSRPWQVLRLCNSNLQADIEMLAGGYSRLHPDRDLCVTVVGQHPVYVGPDVVVHPNVVFDTSSGPILLEASVVVRSISVMVGPAYVGEHSIICNHAHIRAGTVIGPHCKVGGEVNGCVFQGYSNKAHSGFLGNSYVGQWVNLGADTVTSNLKNTYGQVRMRYDIRGDEEDTGMQFLGSIIGDHVKTAIGTRLLTGSCIHTAAMLAVSTFSPKFVGAFTFLTDDGAQRYEFERFCDVARKVMTRREMAPSTAMLQRLRQLHSESAIGRRD